MAGSLFNRLSLEEAGSLNSLRSPGGEREGERERGHGYADYNYDVDIVCHNANTNGVLSILCH